MGFNRVYVFWKQVYMACVAVCKLFNEVSMFSSKAHGFRLACTDDVGNVSPVRFVQVIKLQHQLHFVFLVIKL